jgi:hypothetical protein
MSTGAWLFAGLIGAALVAPAGVYAAVNSKVAIGNPGPSTVTATVTQEHQLLTTTVDPRQMFTFVGNASGICDTLFMPPEGKALMVTNVTFYLGTNGGSEANGILENSHCTAATTSPRQRRTSPRSSTPIPQVFPWTRSR